MKEKWYAEKKWKFEKSITIFSRKKKNYSDHNHIRRFVEDIDYIDQSNEKEKKQLDVFSQTERLNNQIGSYSINKRKLLLVSLINLIISSIILILYLTVKIDEKDKTSLSQAALFNVYLISAFSFVIGFADPPPGILSR